MQRGKRLLPLEQSVCRRTRAAGEGNLNSVVEKIGIHSRRELLATLAASADGPSPAGL